MGRFAVKRVTKQKGMPVKYSPKWMADTYPDITLPSRKIDVLGNPCLVSPKAEEVTEAYH
jgi:hypothetical protein